MNTTLIDYLNLLNEGKKYANDTLNHYFETEDFYITTDGRLLVRVPKNKLNIPITKKETPDFNRVFNRTDYKENPINIPLKDLLTRVNDVPVVNIYNSCLNCSGYGTVLCPCCDSEITCKTCHGTGNEGAPSHKEHDINYHITFYDKYCVNVNVLNRLCSSLITSGYPESTLLSILSDSIKEPIIISVDDITFILVQTMVEYVDTDYLIKL